MSTSALTEGRPATTRETAAAIRRALRESFPATRFSVTMQRGSAYGWIDVIWTDGPTWREVEAITSGFESSRFSGMDDAYHRTENSQWSCRGVSTTRRISEDVLERLRTQVRRNAQGDLIVAGCVECCMSLGGVEQAIWRHAAHLSL